MEGEAQEKAKRLAAQWPKRCGCGLRYDRRAAEQAKGVLSWQALPFGYDYRDEYATQEARHCSCGSTLVILTEIHDLAAE